jgi:hypothetical protein
MSHEFRVFHAGRQEAASLTVASSPNVAKPFVLSSARLHPGLKG